MLLNVFTVFHSRNGLGLVPGYLSCTATHHQSVGLVRIIQHPLTFLRKWEGRLSGKEGMLEIYNQLLKLCAQGPAQ